MTHMGVTLGMSSLLLDKPHVTRIADRSMDNKLMEKKVGLNCLRDRGPIPTLGLLSLL